MRDAGRHHLVDIERRAYGPPAASSLCHRRFIVRVDRRRWRRVVGHHQQPWPGPQALHLVLATSTPAGARIEPPPGRHRGTARRSRRGQARQARAGHRASPLAGIKGRACGPLRALPVHHRPYRDGGRRCRAGQQASGIERWARRRHAWLGAGQPLAGRRANRVSTRPLPPHRQTLTYSYHGPPDRHRGASLRSAASIVDTSPLIG